MILSANGKQNIDYFAVELGCYASDRDAKSYEKVPPPELNEIEKK